MYIRIFFRYLAICRPLQYKPGRWFYLSLVMAISLAVNAGKFLEFQTIREVKKNGTISHVVDRTAYMSDTRYVMFRFGNQVFFSCVPIFNSGFPKVDFYNKIAEGFKLTLICFSRR